MEIVAEGEEPVGDFNFDGDDVEVDDSQPSQSMKEERN